MTIRNLLATANIDSLDKELLLCAALKKPRTWLIAHSDEEVGESICRKFQNYVLRRMHNEPIAYILGEQEFYNRTFHVTSSVLIPRPATENLVSRALQALQGEKVSEISDIDTHIIAWFYAKNTDWEQVKTLVDIGTGSGCIAITLACERPNLQIIATDISKEALKVAHSNAEKHHVTDRIDFRFGKNLEPLRQNTEPYVMISNPPYIPHTEPIQTDVKKFEPHIALFAGEEGTDVLREIVSQAMKDPLCKGWLIECRTEQKDKIMSNATSPAMFDNTSLPFDE